MKPSVKLWLDLLLKAQRQKSIDLVSLRFHVADLCNIRLTILRIDHHLELVRPYLWYLPTIFQIVVLTQIVGPFFEFLTNDYFVLIFQRFISELLFLSFRQLEGHPLFEVHKIHHEGVQVLTQGLLPLFQPWRNSNIPKVVMSNDFEVLFRL